jgi:hypothetical protein
MIQTALGINGYDCTFGDGNTPEEYEAIAVVLLRTAVAIRNGEEGWVKCLRQDGKVLASVLIHHCGPECDEDGLADAPRLRKLPVFAARVRRCATFRDQWSTSIAVPQDSRTTRHGKFRAIFPFQL